MLIRSPYPDLNIPEQDVLTYLFGSGDSLSERPLWINAANPATYLSLRTGLQWIKRLAVGLDRMGVNKGDVLMIVSPNHILVPIAYLGAVGSGRIFSGANPLYTVDGREDLRRSCYWHCTQISSSVASAAGFVQGLLDGSIGTSALSLPTLLPYTISSERITMSTFYFPTFYLFSNTNSTIEAYLS